MQTAEEFRVSVIRTGGMYEVFTLVICDWDYSAAAAAAKYRSSGEETGSSQVGKNQKYITRYPTINLIDSYITTSVLHRKL